MVKPEPDGVYWLYQKAIEERDVRIRSLKKKCDIMVAALFLMALLLAAILSNL